MQDNFEIKAVSRTKQGTSASRRLRNEGLVPGIIYGGDKDPELFSTGHNELLHLLEQEAFYSHILTVNVDGKSQSVVLKDLQRHPAKPFIMHMDLLRISQDGQIKMQIPLHFLNEDTAPGTKAGGIVGHTFNEVEVVCAARDLPEYIEVDVGEMEIGDILHLSDLVLPEGVDLVALSHGDGHDEAVVVIHAHKGGDEDEDVDAAADGVAEAAEGGEE